MCGEGASAFWKAAFEKVGCVFEVLNRFEMLRTAGRFSQRVVVVSEARLGREAANRYRAVKTMGLDVPSSATLVLHSFTLESRLSACGSLGREPLTSDRLGRGRGELNRAPPCCKTLCAKAGIDTVSVSEYMYIYIYIYDEQLQNFTFAGSPTLFHSIARPPSLISHTNSCRVVPCNRRQAMRAAAGGGG